MSANLPNCHSVTCRATPTEAAAAPFFYITPRIFKNLIDKYNTRKAPIESIAPIGELQGCITNNCLQLFTDITGEVLQCRVHPVRFCIVLRSFPTAT